jgi:hypothetical protein
LQARRWAGDSVDLSDEFNYRPSDTVGAENYGCWITGPQEALLLKNHREMVLGLAAGLALHQDREG